MRSLWAGVIGLLLMGFAGWALAEEPPMLPPKLSPEEALAEAFEEGSFWWDVGDEDIVTYSDGAGGMRFEVDLPEERYVGYLSMYSPEEAVGPEAGTWVDGWYEALKARHISIYASESHVVDGRLASLLVRGGPIDGDSQVYSFAWDLRTGEQVRLRDLFYDGIGYIEYINEAAVSALMSTRDLDEYLYPLTFEHLRRPFTGFPRDYPCFSVVNGPHGGRMLVLCVAEQNPLFSRSDNSGMLAVPLTDDLSPYGLPWVEVTMTLDERPLPPDTGFFTVKLAENPGKDEPTQKGYIARVGLGAGVDAETESKVNAQLAALADRAAAHPIRRLLNSYPPLEPWVYYDDDGKRLRAKYYATIYDGEFIYDVAMLAAAEIDLETGELLDGSGLAEAAQDGKVEVAYLLQCGDWEHTYTETELPEGFTLSDGALYLGAWTSYDEEEGERRLCAAWLDPSGVEAYYEESLPE